MSANKTPEDATEDAIRTAIQPNSDQVTCSFESFENANLKPELLRGIHEYGIERPSAVQQRSIGPILNGLDLIVQSRAGTGKTVACCISVLQRVDAFKKSAQALVISPTREVAYRTQELIATLAAHMNLVCTACVGGTHIRDAMTRLEESQVISGTPQRLLDVIRRKWLGTESIEILCLDEIDEVVERGCEDAIHEILQLLPRNTQVVLLAPTMPNHLREFATKLMRDPFRIFVDIGEKDEYMVRNSSESSAQDMLE